MENQMQNQRPTDEIDLFELFNRMGKSMKSLFYWTLEIISSFCILLIRKSLWIFLFTIIGYFVAHFFYFKTEKYYSTELILRSNAINNSIVVNLINSGAFQATSPRNVEKIKSITAYYGIDFNHDRITDLIDYNNSFNPKDTTQKRITDLFYLSINTFDETIINNLVADLKYFVSSNKYINENNIIRLQQTQKLLDEYKDQIHKLDSLERCNCKQKTSTAQITILNEKETKLYYKEIIALYKTVQLLEKDLIIHPDPITLIQGPLQISCVETNNNSFITKKFTVLFALMGLLASLLWQYRVKIWSKIKEK